MSSQDSARHVRAHGLVQGVFFRDTVRQNAERLGVSGWVSNCADGTVEAVFEGPPDAIERLVAQCRSGPGDARVERLEVTERRPEGLDGFAVR